MAHLQRLIASDPTATKWHVILDNLNIHQSESLVRWVAQREGIAAETLDIGRNKKSGNGHWPFTSRECWLFATAHATLRL